MKGGQVVRRNAPDVRMREVAVMSLSADSGPSTGNTSPIWIVEELRLSTRTRRVAKLCLRPIPPIKIERTFVLNRTGQQGNVYQAHQQGKWNPQSSAYGRFWIDVPSGERKRRTVSLGLCATQWVKRACDCMNTSSEQVSVPSTGFTRSQFPVLHFGSRPNGGWSLSLRVDEGRSNQPRSMDGSIAWIDGFSRTLATS